MIPQVRGFQGCYLDNHRNNWRCARAVPALCARCAKTPPLKPSRPLSPLGRPPPLTKRHSEWQNTRCRETPCESVKSRRLLSVRSPLILIMAHPTLFTPVNVLREGQQSINGVCTVTLLGLSCTPAMRGPQLQFDGGAPPSRSTPPPLLLSIGDPCNGA